MIDEHLNNDFKAKGVILPNFLEVNQKESFEETMLFKTFDTII